jgi:REP element-mobilizing transposase RayT
MEDVWSNSTSYLYFIKYAFELRLHAFVLMPNHFHLIVSTPRQNLSEAMNYFMREMSRSVNNQAQQINQLWGARFHRCEVDSYQYYLNAYKYVYYNPVKAILVDRCELYRFSTLNGLIDASNSFLSIEDDIIFSGALEDNLRWINRKPNPDDLEAVRLALRRKKFKLPSRKTYRHPLETQLL